MRRCIFMKKILALILSTVLFLSSCSMQATIPDQSNSFDRYFNHSEEFDAAVEILSNIEFDCLISRADLYSPKGSEDFVGMYIQNMKDQSFDNYENESVQMLFDGCGVKLIDVALKGDSVICCFSFCVPGRSFDYGIYYISSDTPVYFGDMTAELESRGNGFVFEQSASFGTKFTYYTEKITLNYYYYEIS